MTARNGITLRAQWLGQQLRDLREAAGVTLRQAGEYLERNPATVSRFESAEYPIRRPDLLALLDFYGLHDQHRRDGILTLREEAWRTGWWDGYADTVSQRFIDYVWLESRAREIHSYDALLIPGLLQTPAYAEAAIRMAEPDLPTPQVDRAVELRIARQQVLSGSEACKARMLLDESLLRRVVGGTAAMRDQLQRLVACAAMPNVELRLLSLSAGAHAGPTGIFKVLLMAEPYPDVAYTETLAGDLYVEEPGVQRFIDTYNRLQTRALSPDETTTAILAAAEEYT